MQEQLEKMISEAGNRNLFWASFIDSQNLEVMAEVGVYRGHFAEDILKRCSTIQKYIMIDPWRNLEDWNKPANETDGAFEKIYREAMNRTEMAKEKRKVLRGKTTEVIDQIEDESLDFAYIDGDHTLKGITIDLLNVWPKIKDGGFVGGDDFGANIWQHSRKYEPTMVFPYAVYFAEAVGAKIYGLPFNQFLMIKGNTGFEFVDLIDGRYRETGLRTQFTESPLDFIKRKLKKQNPQSSREL